MVYRDKLGQICGFLNIEDEENSGSFIRRYFVLKHSSARLVYYQDNPINLLPAWNTPVGEISLQYISMVSDAKQIRPHVNSCFVINVSGRRYFLEAENEQDKLQWMEELINASKITVPQSGVKSVKSTEWVAGDISQHSYVTDIAGGVVLKMPIQHTEECSAGSSGEAEASPTASCMKPQPPSPQQACGDRLAWPDATVLSDDTVVKSGYGVKQGALRKSWKRRFFVLQENQFSYYKSENDQHPIRSIPTSDILEANISTSGHPNRENLFEFVTTKRTFYIQCDSPEEMHSWIGQIRALISSRKPPSSVPVPHSCDVSVASKTVWALKKTVQSLTSMH
ncbi:pleckstrin homology domain-containing family A member 1-like [Gigantopelta aegis]|uniref:pleckstrin homology domain-containing family A member 1-like n=1 Tax=Gigantopelta aegis TaxID=1735272 RepID=UPI001B88905C|nr:pleckstrin homology domain-containing family A member 1-like [Gigantopelta aegis]XP_041368009.1 pleckstrin homology domain-containing family A member 1-like [Gigantopelta aegis]XP_041368010.1 pleckstrin homology domain-containing family A member 1-like [Gigantopelta aegis]